jgi:hypothetical protein
MNGYGTEGTNTMGTYPGGGGEAGNYKYWDYECVKL